MSISSTDKSIFQTATNVCRYWLSVSLNKALSSHEATLVPEMFSLTSGYALSLEIIMQNTVLLFADLYDVLTSWGLLLAMPWL